MAMSRHVILRGWIVIVLLGVTDHTAHSRTLHSHQSSVEPANIMAANVEGGTDSRSERQNEALPSILKLNSLAIAEGQIELKFVANNSGYAFKGSTSVEALPNFVQASNRPRTIRLENDRIIRPIGKRDKKVPAFYLVRRPRHESNNVMDAVPVNASLDDARGRGTAVRHGVTSNKTSPPPQQLFYPHGDQSGSCLSTCVDRMNAGRQVAEDGEQSSPFPRNGLLLLLNCRTQCKQVSTAGGSYLTKQKTDQAKSRVDPSLISLPSMPDGIGFDTLSAGTDVFPQKRFKRAASSRDTKTSRKGLPLTANRGRTAGAFSPKLRVTTTVSEKRGRLEALIAWERPLESRPGNNNRTTSNHHNNGIPVVYIVHWARETCNLDGRLAYCDDPDVYNSKMIISAEKRINITLSALTYNSEYFVEVEIDGTSFSTKELFTTRGCPHPLDNFRQCPLAPPTTAEPISDHFRPNVTCLFYDVTRDVGRVRIEWLCPSVEDEQVAVWNSTVAVRCLAAEGIHMEMFWTQQSSMELMLEPNRLHEIRIHSNRGSHEIVHEPVYVNVSADLRPDDSLPICSFHLLPVAAAAELVSAGGSSIGLLTLTLVGLALIALVILATTVFARRCCYGYAPIKGSLIGRTAALNANIYRASPRPSPRLVLKQQQGEPMTLEIMGSIGQDEWELDANDVTLGVELGAGAFGLVMTGRWRQTQVAIKVVKDNSTACYREELLREIALMKQIGPHANIVSLVGACTVKEPIALIMEYMPFGNLQSFLQKCRVEGELQRSQAGSQIGISPLDKYPGNSDIWSLTSNDMLSFARQIAIAMEFLAERKYVHCDLAARNVLVGPNKVVKLCDFGLARLVHSGDQYFKLTNGRLPLKWMAIESIRDRVFTAKSDVWSYGVLLWEITTFGASPYSNIALVELYRLLCNGYRLERPQHCSSDLYDLMSQCWLEDPSERASFPSLRSELEAQLGQNCSYLILDSMESPSYPSSPQPVSSKSSSLDAYGAELKKTASCVADTEMGLQRNIQPNTNTSVQCDDTNAVLLLAVNDVREPMERYETLDVNNYCE